MNYLKKILFIISPKNNIKILFLLISILIGSFLEAFGVAMIVPIIELITSGKELFLSLSSIKYLSSIFKIIPELSYFNMIVYSLSFIFVFFTFKAVFMLNMIWQQSKFASQIMSEISQRLFKHYLKKSYSFHLDKNSSKLIHNITSEVVILSSNVTLPFLSLITECLVLVSIFCLLLIIETKITILISILIFFICFIYYILTKNKIYNWGKKRQLHDSLRLKHLQQGLSGIKDIKLLGREKEFLSRFSIDTEEYRKVLFKSSFIIQVPRIGLEYLTILSISLILLIIIYQREDFNSAVSVLAVFTAAAFRIMPSINRILSCVQQLKFSLPVVERVYKELEDYEKLDNFDHEKINNKFKSSIELRNINFKYDNSKEIIKDISFKINKGNSTGIIGESGSGKTTLIDLILGLLDPVSGEIKIDNVNLKKNKRSWQDNIGYVPQFIYLTDDTLRNNIAFGISKNNINNERVKTVVKISHLKEFIDGLPNGLDTIVGERGVKISGGQQQRIGIARSLYHDPDLLILDEATSSLDVETEKKIIDEVNNLKNTKTIIFVSHRLTAVKNCDFIIELDKGKLKKIGKPSEIISI